MKHLRKSGSASIAAAARLMFVAVMVVALIAAGLGAIGIAAQDDTGQPVVAVADELTQPTEGEVPSAEATEVEQVIPVFRDADDGPSLRPNHPPIDQIPEMPMAQPSEITGLPKPEGAESVIYHDAVTGETIISPVDEAALSGAFAQGGGYNGADGGSGSELTPATFYDMYQITNTGAFPWRMNCKLVMRFGSSYYVASGTMRDAETVLTAGHCVYDYGGYGWADEIWVYPGWDGVVEGDNAETYGWGHGTYFGSLVGWTGSGDWDYDLGVIVITRGVGMLTGWYGWSYGGDCAWHMAQTYNNASYPAQNCPLSGLHNGRDMYYWYGSVDACPGNQLTLYTGGGNCYDTVWGGMSGSGLYYIDVGRYVHAVCSTSNRTTIGNYCEERESFVNFTNNTMIPNARGSAFDLQALDVNAGPATIVAGGSTTLLNHFATNPTNGSSASSTRTFRVYLSTNDDISISDTFLSTQNYTWTFGAMSSVRVNMVQVQIPWNTPAGDYWIGVIYDAATDGNSGNNDSDGWDAVPIHVDACSGTDTSCGVHPSCENCNSDDGCYLYGTGCEERDYYCQSNQAGCNYNVSNRNTDYYGPWVYYCDGDTVRMHRLFHNYYCDGGNCVDHTSWVDDQLVEDCNDQDGWYCNEDVREYRDYYCESGTCLYKVIDAEDCNKLDGWYCNGDVREYRDYSCERGTCVYKVTNAEDCNKLDGWYCNGDLREYRDYSCVRDTCVYEVTQTEDCNKLDDWYDTGETRWVDDPDDRCRLIEEKEQDYRDYTCVDGSCEFNVTNTQWLPTGNDMTKGPFDLTISVIGTGTTDPIPGVHPYDCDTDVEITAIETDPSWEFDQWSGDASGTNPTVTVDMLDVMNVTAHFKAVTTLITTDPATNVTPTSVTLNGTLDSLGAASYVHIYFVIGLTSSYTHYVYVDTLSAAPDSFSYYIPSGLIPGTTYHYAAASVDNYGTLVYGNDVTFTYRQPTVTTDAATDVTPTSATLNGTLDSLGSASDVDVYFVIGLTSHYTHYVYVDTLSAAPDSFKYNIPSGLRPGTTYHYAAVLVDNYGALVYGNDVTFTAGGP